MKEMVYSAERIAEILHSGEYKGYKFCIMNLGTHPTAYVECKLDNCNSYYDERLEEISVHGGFTYLGRAYWDEADKTIYLGWDYAHFMDYAGYEIKFSDLLRSRENKRWTTEEIFDEVKNVIDQLIADHQTKGKMNRLEEFLKELSELTQKHGFAINGCGCCGSPWITDFKKEFSAEYLNYDENKQKYEAEYDHPTEKGGVEE